MQQTIKKESPHQSDLSLFAVVFLIVQLALMFLLGLFVRPQTAGIGPGYLETYFSWWQDVNVMVLIGFGFLMSFIRSKAWSALGFTFFINAIVFQMYILWQGLWNKVFKGFDATDRWIQVDITTFIRASFCVASVLIAFGTMIGRISPLMLLILGMVMTIGFSLNQAVIFGGAIQIFDIGGSINVHLFGATAGLVCSFIIGKKAPVGQREPTPSYMSCIFAMIGTLFLWLYWPSSNSSLVPPTLEFQRMVVIQNTSLALAGSCVSMFIFSIFLRGQLHMSDVLSSSIAGGVVIASSSNLLFNFGGAIAIGFVGGMISTVGYYCFSERVKACGIYDTCGIFNLHFLTGLFGGLTSAIVLASYNLIDLESLIGGNLVSFQGVDYSRQAALQVAGTFITIGIAIVTGGVAGLFMNIWYSLKSDMFFEDIHYWNIHSNGPHPYDNTEMVMNDTRVTPSKEDAPKVPSGIQLMESVV